MKISNINGKVDAAGRHNDRNFNLDKAEHIDQSKVSDNIYWTYNGDSESTFAEIERDFYEKHFSEFIERQNEKNKLHRHTNRNKTIDDYVRGRNTRPEDKILQIGNIKEHVSGEELWACAMEYRDRFEEIYGDKCKILDMALHMDEATPHVHIRRVWMAENDEGLEYVSQTAALEQMGITPPYPDKNTSPYNNAKISFTKTDAELFRSIVIDRGIQIDEAKPEKREHLSTLEYKKKAIIEDIAELERVKKGISQEIIDTKQSMDNLNSMVDTLEEYISENPYFEDRYEFELESVKGKDRKERFRVLAQVFANEVRAVTENKEDFEEVAKNLPLEVENNQMKHFIEYKDLTDEYDRYKRGERVKEDEKEEEYAPVRTKNSFF